jgi:hypothetical protein
VSRWAAVVQQLPPAPAGQSASEKTERGTPLLFVVFSLPHHFLIMPEISCIKALRYVLELIKNDDLRNVLISS